MRFTDIFVRRPVLASVISLLILLIGLRSIFMMELREYPETKSTVVSIRTAYPGASAESIQGYVTTPLQQAVAEAEGIDYIASTSTQGTSVIEAHMRLNYDPNAAVAEIQAKVGSQRSQLPQDAQDPVISATTGENMALVYVAFFSDAMSPSQINDYLMRTVQPRIQAIPGVAKATLMGDKTFALRVWLDPKRLASLGMTADDVASALRANNYLAAVGQTKGASVSIDMSAETDIQDPEAFRNMVIRRDQDTLVRLRDVADVELGARNYEMTTWYNGKTTMFLAVEQTPGANPLTVSKEVLGLLPDIESQLPTGLNMDLAVDFSEYISESIAEVFWTLGETVVIVLLVVLISLGSLRAAVIPSVVVPLALVGCCFMMLVMGFSINLLTLLAMLLAIGLVVDDAIVVVENVDRHIFEGQTPFQAAINSGRELVVPIISMTTTLVAVYVPIGFMGGLVGNLFVEFAFALAGSVLISGVIALTLSPMLSSRILKPATGHGRMEAAVQHFFQRLADRYQTLLSSVLDHLAVTMTFAVIVLASIYFMFVTTKTELAPTEDQGILFVQMAAPQTATIDYVQTYAKEMVKQFETIPEYKHSFLMLGGSGSPSLSFGGFKMLPSTERERSVFDVYPEIQGKVSKIPGVQINMAPRPSLPGSGGGFPVQFVLTSAHDFTEMDQMATEILGDAMASGKFMFLRKSTEFSRPRTTLEIDRDRAAQLGIDMKEVGANLSAMLGGGYVNRFSLGGRSYEVIPQVSRDFRANHELLDSYYIRAGSGQLVPLSSIVRFKESVEPSKRTQFQQLNAVTLEGVPAMGTTLGEALETLRGIADTRFSAGYHYDYTGQSRQYAQEGNALIATFFLSILVIYLVLAAQFESWRDPIIILVSVPMSIAGALIFLTLGAATINIYTQVGLITLIGLIAKNGILIVDFANNLQIKEGLDKRAAVLKAAGVRLRPILMTTVAMIFAMVPLLLADGPGAESRFDIGLVISTGLGIGTLFTLFVVPTVYVVLARDQRDRARAAQPHPATP
ncbi:efflux RND transporter permease subunit [Emcibacter sp. SYSU 3D8]|uniref:efflux RND transporter permease subunit n=1 Tax=Emcibacter sp. SYSU 3D8 TaxID=3133969 RepID=UPI0031FF4317